MALFDKITKATQDALRGAKDLTDVARLNSLITDEQRKIGDLFNQIGKSYYENHEEKPPEPFAGMCATVLEAEQKISYYIDLIKNIKGAINCPKCGANNSNNSAFCVNCGSPMAQQVESTPAVKKFCTNCGTEVDAGASFCLSCGQKI